MRLLVREHPIAAGETAGLRAGSGAAGRLADGSRGSIRLGSLALALPLLGVLPACGREREPEFVDLAAGFVPRPLIEIAQGWVAEDEPTTIRRHEDTSEVWIETTLAAEDWSAETEPGRWSAPRPIGGAFRFAPGARTRLAAGATEFDRIQPADTPGPGTYLVSEDRLHLALAADEELPASIVFGIRAGSGIARDGVWRVQGEGRVASGIPLWSGEEEGIRVDLPPRCALSFTGAWVGELAESQTAELRVELDGVELVRLRLGGNEQHAVVPLPARGRRAALLTFEAVGPPGLALVLTPRLRPAKIGSYRERPWGEDRPDVVLFLADTLRADVLAIHGGDPGVTPHLNELAQESVRFLAARATSSWTLPSIASILTGLHPGQHAAFDEDRTLAEEITTIAELFATRGYRTGAVTDHSFFGHEYGLDQGFAWFRESMYPDWDLTRSIDEALEFLDRDDGRPVFLVVHTYRAHAPYRRGPSEDRSTWEELMAMGAERLSQQTGQSKAGAKRRVMVGLADEFRELYLDGVRDLDAEFGRFHAGLRNRGLLEHGVLVFTSDHGEAHGEHEEVGHGKDLWDVKTRVPLLVAAAGIAPHDVDHSVSLVDLAPTLSAIAGLGGPSEWARQSLLVADADRDSFSYLLEAARKQLTIVRGDRKVFLAPTVEALEACDVQRAFDLEGDPREMNPVAQPSWASELCGGLSAELARYLEPLVEAGVLAPHRGPNLRAIGYGGAER